MFARGVGRWLLALWAMTLATSFVAVLSLERESSVLGLPALWVGTAGVLVALAVFLSVFFRDPERVVGPGVVSAADGTVREVVQEAGSWRISVFMNVTNVHVNRIPYPGRVVRIDAGGKSHRPAYSLRATENVQRRYTLATELGTLEVVQMTGIVARRLITWVAPGVVLAKGERFGMVAFGSRVDVVLPAARTQPTVAVGERVRAGSSRIATER